MNMVLNKLNTIASYAAAIFIGHHFTGNQCLVSIVLILISIK